MKTKRTSNLRRAASALLTAVAAGMLGLGGTITPQNLWQEGATAAGMRAAYADATTYSETRRQYKVGILLLDSTADIDANGTITPEEAAKGAENPDPYIFYIADARNDIKPQNWELVNPLAPSTVTADIYKRWSAADDPSTPYNDSGRDPGHPYKLGQKVTKNMAAYWEVSLSRTSEAELLQYDLLFVTHHRIMRLTPAEREKLRRIVDAGAVLWFEDCGGMRFHPSGRFFLEGVQFSGTAAGPFGNAPNQSGPLVYQPAHPLLNSPYRLSFEEVANLGDKNYGNYALVTLRATATTTAQVNQVDNIAPDPSVLATVVGNNARKDASGNGLPYIAAGNYGSGAIVMTAGDSGCDINDYAGGSNPLGSGGNSGAFCGTNIITAHTEDLKFLYNAAAWGSATSTDRLNNRRTGSAFANVNAPLVDGSPATNIKTIAPPLIRQGIMYVTGRESDAGPLTIRAYDMQPLRDYDNDGNPDDGVPDLLGGNGNAPTVYDEIWRYDIPGTGNLSAPTFASLFVNNVQRDAILVTTPQGDLIALDALPRAGNRLSQTGIVLGTNATLTGGAYPRQVPPAPVFFENKIYVVQPNGLVRCVWGGSLAGGGNVDAVWRSNSMAAPPNIQPTGSPALALTRLSVRGYKYSEASNGSTNDVILYVPSVDMNPTGSTLPPSRILPYWLGTRNEVIKDIVSNRGAGTPVTRVSTRVGDNQATYFIAKGPDAGQLWAIRPRARIYAGDPPNATNPRTPEQLYAAGVEAPGYAAVWEDAAGNADYYSGLIRITRNGSDFDYTLSTQPKLLVVVDYDVMYVPGSGSGADGPPGLSTQMGARGGNTSVTLSIPGAVRGETPDTAEFGLNTVAVGPNDLLIYAATQAADDSTGANGVLGSVYALNEQESVNDGSRLRWRYSLHPGGVDATGALVPFQVDGTTVYEMPALRNRLVFGSDWPTQSEATMMDEAPFYEPLRNVRTVGSPVVSNDGLTYILAQAESTINGGLVTVLMAFKTAPDIVLTLPTPYDPNSPVTLTQINGRTINPGDPTSFRTVTTSFTNRGEGSNQQVVGDPARGKITLIGFGSGDNAFSASNSFVVRYTPAGGTANGTAQPVVISPYPAVTDNSAANADLLTQQVGDVNGNQSRRVGGGFSPLQWYYVLPGFPTGSPTLVGDYVYVNVTTNNETRVLALDANPAGGDATVRVGTGEQVFNVVDSLTPASGGAAKATAINHVRWTANLRTVATAGGGAVVGAPVGGEGTLAVSTDQGVRVYQEGLTLVADSKRIIEVDGDSGAVWAVDSTLNAFIAGGAPPYPLNGGGVLNPAQTGRYVTDRKTLSKPQIARKLGSADYLLADTGNDRVVRIDRTGKVTYSADSFTDPYRILSAGDPLTLNRPTDVQTYQVITYAADNVTVIGREVHYLIADAGNSRVVDLVDYYDGQGRIRTNLPNFNPNVPDAVPGGTRQARGEKVVVWTTRTSSREGRPLRYQSLRILPDLTDDKLYMGRPRVFAVVGNTTAAGGNSSAAADFTGGSVVELDYNPYDTLFSLYPVAGGNPIPERFWDPATGTQSPMDTEPARNGRVRFTISDIWIRDSPDQPGGRLKRITRPTVFDYIKLPIRPTVGETAQVEPVYIIGDAEGVYACTLRAYPGETGNGTTPVFAAFWKYEQRDYNRMNGVLFDPSNPDVNTVNAGRMTFTANNGTPLTALTRAQYAALPRLSVSSAKRLANGNFLIANSAAASSPYFITGQFFGEVFEVTPLDPNGTPIDSSTLGFVANFTASGGLFANFSAPKMGARNGRNVQQMGAGKNTFPTEQPLSADRL